MMQTPAILSKEAYDRIVSAVLNQPGYWHLRNTWSDFIENIRKIIEDWVIETLKRLFEQPQVSTPFSSGVSVAVIILGAVALIGVLLLVAGVFAGVFSRAPKVHGILGEAITPQTTPETLMEKSRTAERSGDIRQAIRFGFIAVLLKMHRARLVFLDETWTNQELYQHLERSRFVSLVALKDVMEGFNASWYGHKPPSGAGYMQWQASLEQVWQEVTSREV